MSCLILDVDDGSTVTDFLPAERARGITIQSAAITLHWPPESLETKSPMQMNHGNAHKQPYGQPSPHTINLIDTPGHADFTFEVLRSLRILDGAVCILDGVAGVEAQTEKVWYQANNHKIPKIIYVNKLDRDGAAFGRTIREIASRLHAWPAVCQIPWFEGGVGRFQGVVDVIRLEAYRWPEAGDGKSFKIMNMKELEAIDDRLVEEVRKARIALVEVLSERDDFMVEKYLEHNEDHMQILASEIVTSLKRCVLDSTTDLVPVFAGASFRNVGVQPLLDAVVEYLPNPAQAIDPQIIMGALRGGLNDLVQGRLVAKQDKSPSKHGKNSSRKSADASTKNLESCALAFKVVADPKRGVLVYIRVYHGSINRNIFLYNTNLGISERPGRLLRMYASDAVETDSIPAGQIGVIIGLKHARTGDTLLSYTGVNPKNGPPSPFNSLQLAPIEVPPPVFFASIEPQSLSEERPVKDRLELLLREDPSLQLSVDEDSGQTLLSGMGELHLEIARDRLIQDFKAKATMGKIEIGYRECITTSAGPETTVFEKEQAGKRGKAGCMVSVRPFEDNAQKQHSVDEETYSWEQDSNLISVNIRPPNQQDEPSHHELADLGDHSPQSLSVALKNGALAALARGPGHSFPVHSCVVSIEFDPAKHFFGIETTLAALSSAARSATRSALKSSSLLGRNAIMEPVMNVIINADEASLGAVVHDLSSARGGHIISLEDADIITATGTGGTREDVSLIDVNKVYAPRDPFASFTAHESQSGALSDNPNRPRTVTAKVPLREMIGYLKHLRSLTGGRGTFVMSVDRFERMGSQREKTVLKELNGI
ncbi:Ribosome-releasing factor 2, mitochondrial [Bachmanniomyces sp. S44760]|nr:Ribosome-releasing factor 2, mitochondrial [Bachmanniomyces sp. S44760]